MDKTNLSQVKGVGAVSADRLQAGGIKTVHGLARSPVEKIAELTGFPAVRAALIRAAAAELLEATGSDTPIDTALLSVAKAGKKKTKKKAAKEKDGKKDKKRPGKKDKKSKKRRDRKKGKKSKKGKKK